MVFEVRSSLQAFRIIISRLINLKGRSRVLYKILSLLPIICFHRRLNAAEIIIIFNSKINLCVDLHHLVWRNVGNLELSESLRVLEQEVVMKFDKGWTAIMNHLV